VEAGNFFAEVCQSFGADSRESLEGLFFTHEVGASLFTTSLLRNPVESLNYFGRTLHSPYYCNFVRGERFGPGTPASLFR